MANSVRATGAALLAVLAGAVATAQQQQPAAPVFRSSVDVTTVDVSVYDDRGRVVSDLTPDDFIVRIEGAARPVVSAQYLPLDAPPPGTAAPAAPEGFSTNEAATSGRLILIVIDQPNIRFGGTLAIQRSVNGFIDRLQPSDRAAVIGIGPGSVATPFTADHARLKRAATQMTGMFRPPAIHLHHIGLTEALEILAGDTNTLYTVAIRECTTQGTTATIGNLTLNPAARDRLDADQEFVGCRFEIEQEARDMARESTTDGRQTISALRSLLMALRGLDTPKTMVLVSEGFIMEDQHPEVVELGALATAAHTSIYALKLDDQLFTQLAVDSPRQIARMTDRQARSEGLELLADSSRGSVMNVLGNGQAAFDRIQSELAGYYLIGVESAPTDKDGKPHSLRIELKRKGLTVRSRRAVVAAPPAARPPTTREAVASALASPLPVAALPLRLTTYSLQGPEPGKVQLLIHADIGADYSSSRVVSLGYVFTDLDGRVVDSQTATARVPPVMSGVPSPLQFTAGASLAPGDYLLKLAVVEGDRTGTVEHPVRATVSGEGALRFSDLIVGGPVSLNLQMQQPSAGYTVAFGAVHGYVEAYGASASQLTAKFEIAETPTAPAILTEDVTPMAAGGGSRAIFSRIVSARQLPPGKYFLRAVLSAPDIRPAVLTRPFEVAAPAVLMTSADPGASADAPLTDNYVYLPLSDALLSRPFDRAAALDAKLLDRFRTRVSEPLLPAFEEGVRQLRDGSFAEAESSFKKVMNPEGDSTAALAYLAATFAASGHDLQATSAWQTSLVDGSEIPQIYEWLANAALRVRDMAQARATLEEAIAKWPGDVRFARPMAMVYAGFGQGAEAVRSLERYLAEHPDDVEMLFAGVEWIYQLRLAGATAHGPAADVQLARKYADAYIKASGPQVALVRQWMTYLEGKR